jgi:hypothetical protein
LASILIRSQYLYNAQNSTALLQGIIAFNSYQQGRQQLFKICSIVWNMESKELIKKLLWQSLLCKTIRQNIQA